MHSAAAPIAAEAGAPAPAVEQRHGGPLAAMRHADFRFLFYGFLLSSIVYDIQLAAAYWHVYELTRSEMQLGLTALASALPLVLLGLWGGVMADRWDRRLVLQVCQVVLVVGNLTLGLLTVLGMADVVHILAATLLLGAVRSFDAPARAALVPNTVPREHLLNAVGLTSAASQISHLIGPALAGVFILLVGLGGAYLLNGLVCLSIIISLAAIRAVPSLDQNGRKSTLRSIGDGVAFVLRTPIIWMPMSLDLASQLFTAFRALLPVFAQEIHQVGAAGYGMLASAPAVGSLLGASVIISLGNYRRKGILFLVALVGYCVAMAVFALTSSFPLALVALGLVGLFDAASATVRRALVQLETPDHIRGRASSVHLIVVKGGPAVGALQLGALAAIWGAPLVLTLGATLSLVCTGLVWSKGKAVREYQA
jgi:MFS family permease